MEHNDSGMCWGRQKMKVFISWSGKTSFEVAKVLKEWIPCVIQDIEPYFSSDDIDKGARWSTDIAKELEAAEFGILCVTKNNLKSEWLNFEAGALSKAIDKSRVCPFLFNLQPSDISKSPILQFQMTSVDRDDMYKLFMSINRALGEEALEETRLKKMFELSWNRIDGALKGIEETTTTEDSPEKSETKTDQSKIFEEMLDLLRSQQVMLRDPEHFFPDKLIKKISEACKGKSYDEELANRIPRILLIQQGDLKRQLVEMENILADCDFSNPDLVQRYIALSKDLRITEEDLYDRIGVNQFVRYIRRIKS